MIVKRKLIRSNLVNKKREIASSGSYLFIPIVKRTEVEKLKLGKIAEYKAPLKKTKVKTFTELLKGKLTKEEIKLVGTSYDVLGDVAIIEILPELEKKEKIIVIFIV